MKIVYDKLMLLGEKFVWFSEKGNIAITSCDGMYFVLVKVFFGSASTWNNIASFKKQSYAINFACTIKDTPVIEC